MRTKHLLAAMVLPALFAACTSEELDVVSNGAETSRAVVENVKLNFNTGVESRLYYDYDGYHFEANDQIGAALMDVITSEYGKKDVHGVYAWSDWFDLTDYIQTNYKFTRDEVGNWETEAKLCEGNYFFSFPYNKNLGLRDAYAFNCEDQVLEGTDRQSLMDAYAKNNAFIGYGKVMAGDNDYESVDIDMVPVFGPTGFVITNRGTEERTIEKIVLRGKNVVATAMVNPTTCTYALAGNSEEFNVGQYTKDAWDGYNGNWKDENKNPYDKFVALADLIDYGVTDIYPKIEENPANGNVNEEDLPFIEVYIKSGNTLKPGESMNVIVMSGYAQVTKDEPVYMDIYSTRGVLRDIDLSVEHRVNEDDKVTDYVLNELGVGEKVEIEFSHSTFDVLEEMDIYSDDDLAKLIKWNDEVLGHDREIVANLKADVTLTKAMYEKMNNNKKIVSATINGEYMLTVAADVPAEAIDAFDMNAAVVKVLGTQTIAKDKELTSNIIVAEGATLNVAKDVNVEDQVITNNGTLNITAQKEICSINNAGAINVTGKATIKELNNIGTVTNDAAILTIKAGKNNGTITNNGSLNADGFENAAKFAALCVEHHVQHPAGVINNNGKISNLLNNATVNILKVTAEYIDSNASSTGDIENSIISKLVNKAADENILVTVSGDDIKASELVTIVKESGVSKLNLSGTLVLDPQTDKNGNLLPIEVVGQETTLAIAAGNLKVTGKGKIRFCQNKLNTECADIDVQAGKEFTVDSDVILVAENIKGSGHMTVVKGAEVLLYGDASVSKSVYGTCKENI